MPTIEEFMKQYGGGAQKQPEQQSVQQTEPVQEQKPRRTVADFMNQYGGDAYQNNPYRPKSAIVVQQPEQPKQNGLFQLPELPKPASAPSVQPTVTNSQARQNYLNELRSLEEQAGYITDPEQSMANATRRREITNALEEMDRLEGNDPRYYDEATRAQGVLGGWANRTGGSYLSTLGTLGQLAEMQDETGQALADSEYAGWITDDLTASNMRQAVESGQEAKSDGSFRTNREMLEKADELLGRNEELMAKVYNGASGADRLLADVTGGALDLASDAVANKFLPGFGLINMGVRSFGQGAYDQRQKGGDVGKQILSGSKSAAIEILTEKIGGPFENIYGKTLTGEARRGLLKKLNNPVIRNGLWLASGFLSEGSEEVLSDILNPVADRLLRLGKDEAGFQKGWFKEDFWNKDFLVNTIYDGLIGGLLGLVGEGINVSTGAKATPEQKQAAIENAQQEAVAAVDRAIAERAEQNAQEEQPVQQSPSEAAESSLPQGGIPAPAEGAEAPTAQAQEFNLQPEAAEEAPAPASAKTGPHIDQRDSGSVASRGIKAFQNEHPEIHPFYVKAAEALREDIIASIGSDVPKRGGGTSYHYTELMRRATKGFGLTRNQAIEALNQIIEDNGVENNAAAKRMELLLDDMLTNGYVPLGNRASFAADPAYLEAKAKISGANSADALEYRRRQAIREEMELAAIEGEELTEEQAAGIVQKYYDEHGYFSVADQARQQGIDGRRPNAYDEENGEEANYGRETKHPGPDQRNDPGAVDGRQADTETPEHDGGGTDGRPGSVGGQNRLASLSVQQRAELTQKVSEAAQKLDGDYMQDAARMSAEDRQAILDGIADQLVYDFDSGKDITAYAKDLGDLTEIVDLLENAERGETGLAVRENNAPQERIATPPAEARDDSERGEFETLGERYGTIEQGENPARESAIPKQIDETRKTGEAARTIYEAGATPESRLADIRSAVLDGKFAYVSISNEELANEASKKVEADGWEKAVRDWTADVRSGKANEKLAAMGATLLNNAGNSTMSGEEYIELATDYNNLMHRLGRGLAAARILKTLTPEARLYAIQKTVQRINEERSGKSAKKKSAGKTADEAAQKIADAKDIKLNPRLVEEFMKAETDEQRDAIISQMQKNIADQIPATVMEKWNALRYLNMLGNFKTQIRNVVGNTTMMVTAMAKNHAVKAIIEGLYGKVDSGYEKTSAVAYNPKLFAEAFRDWFSVKDEAMGERKYSDAGRQFEKGIDEKRRIFKFAPLEGYRKASNWAMEAGDQIFSVMNYADAMAGWMAAHKVQNVSEMSQEMLDRARTYAIQQAQEATFRDTNAVSNWASRLGRGNKDTAFGKAVGLITEGVVPFRKTPANVMVRAWEYSPFGTLTAIGNKIAGKSDAQTFIDDLSKAFTGSGIAYVGYLLAAAGKLRLPDEDDKKEYFNKDRGLQDYSFITDDGKSITLDWLAPDCIPLFAGAEMYEILHGNGVSGDDAMKIFGQMTEPMLEMSMLSGLNDALEYSTSNTNDMGALPSLVAYSLLSYLNQGLGNSLLRQGEQASENVRRTSYTDKESAVPNFAQRKLSQFLAGVPGVDYQQGDYIDAWGRKQEQGYEVQRIWQSFFNPAYVQEDRSTPYDEELIRLYDAGMTGAIPQAPSRSAKVNGQQLSPEEYEMYAMVSGQKKLELIGDFLDSKEYQQLDDDERADIIGNLYQYANYQAAKTIAQLRKEQHEDKNWDKVYTVERTGVDVFDYLLGQKNANADGEGSLKNTEVFDWLWNSDYTEKQQSAIWNANRGSSNKSWADYKATNPVAILADFGIQGRQAQRIASAIDPEWSSVSSFSQEELWNYYKAHPDQEEAIAALWDAKGGSTSWADYRRKHG